MTISDNTIRQNVFSTIRGLINSAKSSYGASSVPTLYGTYPDINSISFPAIVLDLVNVNESNYTIDTTRSTSDKTITVVVTIFTKRNDDADILSDGITSTLRTVINGIVLVNVSEDNSLVEPNMNKIKVKTLSFTYMRR